MSLEALGDLVSRAPTDEGAHRMLVDYLDEHGHPMLADVLRKGTWKEAPTSTDKTWWQPKQDDDDLRVSLDLSHHPLLASARIHRIVRGKDDTGRRHINLHFKHAPDHTFSFTDLPAHESKQLRQEQGVVNRRVDLSRETEEALWKRWAENPEDEAARGYLADYLSETGSPLEPLVRKAKVYRTNHGIDSNQFLVIDGERYNKASKATFNHTHPAIRTAFLYTQPHLKHIDFALRGARNHGVTTALTYPEMKAIYRHLRDNHKTDNLEFQEFDPEPEVNVRRVDLARKKPIPTPGQLFAAFRDVLKSPLMLARPPKNVEGGEYGHDDFKVNGDWQDAALAQEIWDEKFGPGHWLHWLGRRLMKQKDEGRNFSTYHERDRRLRRLTGVPYGLRTLSNTPILYAKQPQGSLNKTHPSAIGLWAFYLDDLSSENPVGRLFQVNNNPAPIGYTDKDEPIYAENPKFKWKVGNPWSHPIRFDSHDDLDEWLRDAKGHAERHGHKHTLKTLKQMEAQIAAARNVPKE